MARGEIQDTTYKNTLDTSEWPGFEDPLGDRGPDFKTVGRFIGDWGDELKNIKNLLPAGYNQHGEMWGFKAKKSKEAMNEKPGHGFPKDLQYYEATRVIPPTVHKMVGLLGMDIPDPRIHRQKPGGMIPMHIDTYKSHSARAVQGEKYNIDAVERFAIALEDWKIGHLWLIGATPWVKWRAGEIIFSRMRDVPHCTANCSIFPRHTLLVTGIMTEKSWELVNGSYCEFRL